MPEKEDKPHKGHILARLGLGKYLIKYYEDIPKLHARLYEFRQGILDGLGMVSRERVEAAGERLDRIEGLLRKRGATK